MNRNEEYRTLLAEMENTPPPRRSGGLCLQSRRKGPAQKAAEPVLRPGLPGGALPPPLSWPSTCPSPLPWPAGRCLC